MSNADYNFLKNKLRKEKTQDWYFVVRYLAATGARVSELIQIKVEHVSVGYFDIYTKEEQIRIATNLDKSLRQMREKLIL
jgi:Phage integrase family.